MAMLLGPGGLHEDGCGTWDYTPNTDLRPPDRPAPWFAQQTERLLALLGDFAGVESVELHGADTEQEWEWAPPEPVERLLSEIRSRQAILSVVVWLSLKVSAADGEHALSAGVVRFVVYSDPFDHEVSLQLDTHAYVGRAGLSPEAVQANHQRLEAFLKRLEAGLDVRFNHCESQAFPLRIYRFGYHPTPSG